MYCPTCGVVDGLTARCLRCGSLVPSPEHILSVLSREYGIPTINLDRFVLEDPTPLKLIPVEEARKHRIVALSLSESQLAVAIGNLSDQAAMSAIEILAFQTGLDVVLVLALESQIRAWIDRYYPLKPVPPVREP
jgi:hypothetical protein